jgi:hypothetical protein
MFYTREWQPCVPSSAIIPRTIVRKEEEVVYSEQASALSIQQQQQQACPSVRPAVKSNHSECVQQLDGVRSKSTDWQRLLPQIGFAVFQKIIISGKRVGKNSFFTRIELQSVKLKNV